MSILPVVDYNRVRRIYVPPDPLPGTDINWATKICFFIMFIGVIILIKRWRDKQVASSSNVRLQKV